MCVDKECSLATVTEMYSWYALKSWIEYPEGKSTTGIARTLRLPYLIKMFGQMQSINVFQLVNLKRIIQLQNTLVINSNSTERRI